MSELFGLPMTHIMWVLVGLFAVSIGSVLVIYLSNRTMFKIGLRNIPRRGAQTALVVVGLMISTLIITVSFTTGDTIDYSITKKAYDHHGRTDLSISLNGPGMEGRGGYLDEALVGTLQSRFAIDPDIDGFIPALADAVPAANPRTRLAEPDVQLVGLDPVIQDRFGGLRLREGGVALVASLRPDQVYINRTIADNFDARAGDTITVYARGREQVLEVAGIVEDELASGAIDIDPGARRSGGMAARLATVQELTGQPGKVNRIGVALKGEVRGSEKRSGPVAERLETYFKSDEGKAAAGTGGGSVLVEKLKQDAVKEAEMFGNLFTTFFLVLGLFSIAAGTLLIFMIFVMLAAERKAEMGMMRAVGARQANLVQMFVSEGMIYNLMAGMVGAALGVGTAFALIVVGMKAMLGDEVDFLTAHVTPRSLIISYCLGVVFTFITVVVSSARVSRLNIVAAVRGSDDVKAREKRRGISLKWLLFGMLTLPVLPLGPYWLLRRGLGLPSAWVWGPMGLVFGALLMLVGKSSEMLFPFSLGISLLPLAAAGIARHYGTPNRATWTVVGVLLLVYWLSPNSLLEKLFGTFDSDVEMFVLSGIMIVIGFTLVIVFNARLLTALFQRGEGGRSYTAPVLLVVGAVLSGGGGLALGDNGDGLGQLLFLVAALLTVAAALSLAAIRFPVLAPALKMGVAYPLASRFRTGMTIAMFSLIVFSIVVMSTLNANFAALLAGDEARGGWDIIAESNRSNPVTDFTGELGAAGGFETATISLAARATAVDGMQEVRQAGRQSEWSRYWVRAGDDSFFAGNQAKLQIRDRRYTSDRDVFEAVRTTPGLAVMDFMPVPSGNMGEGGWKVSGVTTGDATMDPIQVEVRDPATGASTTLTVIGVLSRKILYDVMPGIYTNEPTFARVFGQPEYRVHFLRLVPGTDAERAAKDIKSALLAKGVQAFSIQERIDTQQEENIGFTRLFQGFMALGLAVGIVALGVIAFRAVVERRQQIGMLRAIGYQRGTVALTFLLESSFIAMMGILSGVVGAAILSRNLLSSGMFGGEGATNFKYFIPWSEVVVFVAVAYIFSLLLTWWPSRSASRVPIAEALRYE